MRRRTIAVLLSGVLLLTIFSSSHAKPPWASLLPFTRVEADPGQSYELTEEHGPWLILAASFAGEQAGRRAHQLVMELRKRYKLPAYVYRQHYDYTKTMDGLTYDKYDNRKRMKYANGGEYDMVAVLIGDFPSINEPDLEKTLEQVKYAHPECLEGRNGQADRNWSPKELYIGFRELYRRASGDEEKRRKGRMGSAFVTRNPLLPKEYFAPEGPDDFVLRLNRGVQYSLLDNSGKYTVRVATFRGEETINQREIAELMHSERVSDKLQVAAGRAHQVTMTLRKQGVEAYEYHDRQESIVTVGSFETEGTPLDDGTIEINPAVLRVMQTYGAKKRRIPGKNQIGLQPTRVAGIALDVQPKPMKVPRRSIGQDYAPDRFSLFD